MKPDQEVTARRALAPVVRGHTRLRTSDRVYDELLSAIRDLRIPPGASLSETDLAEQLHVSRTPLREAIARLVDNGLVSVVPQVGTRVELISLHDVKQAQFVRENLEVPAVTAACQKPQRDVRRLRELLVEQERCHQIHDIDAFFAADEALHEQVFTISGYPGAWRAMKPTQLQLDRLRRLSLPEPATVRALIDEHIAIVDALEAGDSRSARTVTCKHVRRVLDYGLGLQAHHVGYFTE